MSSGHFAGPNGRRALLFINNPHAVGYVDATGIGAGYDILTAPSKASYSVPYNRKSVGDGDVAVVYRVDAHAVRRDPGHVVAVACITSSPWFDRNGYAQVNWDVQLLPPEFWIPSADMIGSGHWIKRSPFTANKQASSPVELDGPQWGWLSARLPKAAVKRMRKHSS